MTTYKLYQIGAMTEAEADEIAAMCGPREEAAQVFWKNRAEAAVNLYDETADPAAYYGGFAAYYQACLTGTDAGKVRSPYAGALNEAQKQAAGLWQKAYDAAAQQAQTAQKNAAHSDGETRYSIKHVGGKQIVWIENSVLTSKELQSHSAVASYIAQHVGEVYTIIEYGQKV